MDPATATTAAPRRWWRAPLRWLGWIAVAVFAWLAWPATLGGEMSYVLVSGESMTPGYQPGDLVIARTGEPQIGDVIVYAPEGHGGAQIVHRVIGGDASGWEVRGDANSFTDPFTPAGSEVVGVVQWHVGGTGPFVALLLSPWLWIGLFALAAGLWVWPSRTNEVDATDAKEPELEEIPEEAPQLVDSVRGV